MNDMMLQSSATGQSLSDGSGTDWQIVGKLELPFGVDAHSMINAWLRDVLTPLHLDVDFLNQIRRSAEDVAVRALQPATVMNYQHTHLRIYIPANRPLNVPSWGFFRIEKVETAAGNKHARAHSIEFYLFLEG